MRAHVRVSVGFARVCEFMYVYFMYRYECVSLCMCLRVCGHACGRACVYSHACARSGE